MIDNGLILGLDMGIASCGYALVDEANGKIVKAGVYCFDKAENPKDGSSLALPRRQKRILRRLLRRRAQRLRNLKALFGTQGVIIQPSGGATQASPWELRAAALERQLSGSELVKVLLHIAKRRGFKSAARENPSENEAESDKELGRLKEGVQRLRREFQNAGFRTIGSYINSLDKKRNSDGEYLRTVDRDLLVEEVREIFASQRNLGNSFATDDLLTKYLSIAFKQRPLRSTESLVGKCGFEQQEKRAPRASITAQRFKLLQSLNHLKIESSDGTEYILDDEERSTIYEDAFKTEKISYSRLRKLIELPSEYRFLQVRYSNEEVDGDRKDPERTTNFISLKDYHALRRALSESAPEFWNKIERNTILYDLVAWILTVEKDAEKTTTRLKEAGVPEHIISRLLPLNFSSHMSLSTKAMNKIIPFLQRRLVYSEACAQAGYDFRQELKGRESKRMPPIDQEEVRNPVVLRSLSKARKLVNALIREYGIPAQVNVEFARELGKSIQERKKIETEQEKSRKVKERHAQHFKELTSREPRPFELTKFRLFQEQGHLCPYTGEKINVSELEDPQALEVDHIVPYSRCFDDSWSNRVLVKTKGNRDKKARTPFEWFGSDEARWSKFEAVVSKFPFLKKKKLLSRTSPSESDLWKSRHLNDTRYITKSFTDHMLKHLPLVTEGRRRVFVRAGRVTARLRWQWGLEKNRDESDLHHALDAIVVACTTERMLQRIVKAEQARELGLRPRFDRSAEFEPPWAGFRDDVIKTLSEVFVVRAPRRRARGALHEDTVRSLRVLSDKKSVITQRVSILQLKLKNLELLHDRGTRNQKLYDVLRTRLMAFNDNPEKAFAEPVYMPTNNPGRRGPQIKRVVIQTKERSGVRVRGGNTKRARFGIASNGSMVRVDVYSRKGKYYLVPVYSRQVLKGEIPNRAIEANKAESEWPLITEEFLFHFSVFPYDYIAITGSKGEGFEGYYTGAHRGTGAIYLLLHNGGEERVFGARTLKKFQKFYVDLLGRRFEVKQEKRPDVVANRCNIQPREAELSK